MKLRATLALVLAATLGGVGATGASASMRDRLPGGTAAIDTEVAPTTGTQLVPTSVDRSSEVVVWNYDVAEGQRFRITGPVYYQSGGAIWRQNQLNDGPWVNAAGPESIAPDVRFTSGSSASGYTLTGSIADSSTYRFKIQRGNHWQMPPGENMLEIIQITVGSGVPVVPPSPVATPEISFLQGHGPVVVMDLPASALTGTHRYVVRYRTEGDAVGVHRVMQIRGRDFSGGYLTQDGDRIRMLARAALPTGRVSQVEVAVVPGTLSDSWHGGQVLVTAETRPTTDDGFILPGGIAWQPVLGG